MPSIKLNSMARHRVTIAWILLTAVTLTSTPIHAWEISSYAFINDDGSLDIKGETIQLYGIHIPETGHHCRSNFRPPECGSRAALALEFKIQGFVRCKIKARASNDRLIGHCRSNVSSFNEGTDLSAYLLERGWAVALPDAPVEYHTLEKIAYRRGIGLWGFPVDNVIRKR